MVAELSLFAGFAAFGLLLCLRRRREEAEVETRFSAAPRRRLKETDHGKLLFEPNGLDLLSSMLHPSI